MFESVQDRRKGHINSFFIGILIVATLYFAREVFIPLALAGLVTFLLAPVANRLERWGLQRTVAGLLVIGLSLSAVSAVCWVVLGQIYNLAVELPQYQQNVTHKIEALHLHSSGKLTSTVQMLSQVNKQLSTGESKISLPQAPIAPSKARKSKSAALKPSADAGELAQRGAEPAPVPVRVEESDGSIFSVASRNFQPVLEPLTRTFVVVVFVIFMLLARDDIRDRAIRLAGSGRIHIATVAMSDAAERVSRYLLMQFLVNLSYGAVIGVALWRIGLPHPLLWAVMTSLLRFVPYVGILAAGTGPVLIAIAVSPDWRQVAWTFGVYVVMELISANAVEPYLYGSSTGVSSLAILIAAIFWTWLWGLAGLLLSTPLTVCLIVLGRHVPHLEFIGVLFGEEEVLAPSQRFYQRILASDSADAGRLLEEHLHGRSPQETYDAVVIPALSLIEDARHSEEIDTLRAEEALQRVEEVIEEHWSRSAAPATSRSQRHRVVCIPARDFADELACQLLKEVISEEAVTRVLPADVQNAEIAEMISQYRPDLVCVVGIPPQSVRHVRLRCHQLRDRLPDAVILACVLSTECDLSNIRGRVPLADAQHVAVSLLQTMEYLSALQPPSPESTEVDRAASGREPREEGQREMLEERKELEMLDETKDDIFDRIAQNLAKSFDAPIAIVNVKDGDRAVWRSQCGLPEDDEDASSPLRKLTICSQPVVEKSPVVVPDTAEDERFAQDPFLKEKGIRFFAGAPILSNDGREIGALCVFDTRPRQITDQQREILSALAESVTNAVELRAESVREEIDSRESHDARATV